MFEQPANIFQIRNNHLGINEFLFRKWSINTVLNFGNHYERKTVWWTSTKKTYFNKCIKGHLLRFSSIFFLFIYLKEHSFDSWCYLRLQQQKISWRKIPKYDVICIDAVKEILIKRLHFFLLKFSVNKTSFTFLNYGVLYLLNPNSMFANNTISINY